MNKNKLYIILGIVLPTIFLLTMDFILVKNKRYLGDVFTWLIWMSLSTPFLFIGISRIVNKRYISILLTIAVVSCLLLANIILLLNFHFWIGGAK